MVLLLMGILHIAIICLLNKAFTMDYIKIAIALVVIYLFVSLCCFYIVWKRDFVTSVDKFEDKMLCGHISVCWPLYLKSIMRGKDVS